MNPVVCPANLSDTVLLDPNMQQLQFQFDLPGFEDSSYTVIFEPPDSFSIYKSGSHVVAFLLLNQTSFPTISVSLTVPTTVRILTVTGMYMTLKEVCNFTAFLTYLTEEACTNDHRTTFFAFHFLTSIDLTVNISEALVRLN